MKRVILTPMNLLYRINPKGTLKILYRIKTGRKLNLDNPKCFNEKIQWIKLYYRNDLLPVCSDKYEVRQYIKECGCENILDRLLWNGLNPYEIPFEDLPDKFVIKVTHGQGYNMICRDKSKLNIPKTIRKLKRWLKEKYIPCYGEWFYGIIKPRIIIEEFLEDGEKETPIDYKVYCFHGEPKLINVHVDRFTNHRSNLYDLDWNIIKQVNTKYVASNLSIEKPSTLNQMLEYARKLSADFIHVRVDFYIIHSKIYFGELTFTDSAGFDKFTPIEFEELMGSWIHLPMKE